MEERYWREIESYDLIEKDWKLFRKKLPGWQERYMGKLVRQYIDLLSTDQKASSRFWALDKRIKRDKRNTGVMISRVSRSHMLDIFEMLRVDGVIVESDMEGFSRELKDYMRYGWVLTDEIREEVESKPDAGPKREGGWAHPYENDYDPSSAFYFTCSSPVHGGFFRRSRLCGQCEKFEISL